MNPLDLVRPEVRSLRPYTITHATARVKLDANESPYDVPEAIAGEIAHNLRQVALNRYPDPAAAKLKEMIGRTLRVDPGSLMLGNGSDELISYLITTFTGQEKGVLFPTPTFAMYGITAAALGQRTIEVPLGDDFGLDPDPFLQAVHESSPQLVFLATPNNPTGNAFPGDLILRILDEARTMVVVDEAYIDYSREAGFLQSVKSFPNLVILRTLSKIGMAALRIGILCANPRVLAELEKVRLPYNINSYSQAAASAILGHWEILEDQVARIVSQREQMEKAMAAIPEIRVFPSKANFILFKTGSADRLYGHLCGKGILIRNLNQPGALEGCLRVTVGKPEENREFLEHLTAYFAINC